MTELDTADGRQGRLELLDGLRFVAALGVVAYHFTARESSAWGGGPVPEALRPVGTWAAYGELGVPLFFVISGFVLLMTAWDKTVPAFVASRIGRLFPAYWAAVAVSLVIVLVLWPEGWASMGRVISRSTALLNVTMVQGAFGVPDVDGPYWTLWYELRFYLLVVMLMLVGITRARVLAFATLWPIAGALTEHTGSVLLTTMLMPDYACYFAGGMLLYLVHRDGHDRGLWLLIGLQCVIGLSTSVTAYQSVHAADLSWGRSSLLLSLGIVGCFGLVALVTLAPWAGRSFRGMAFLGALTYPLYLVHENLGWYLINVLEARTGPWAAVFAATAVSLLAAVAIHQWVEKPLGPRLRRVVVDTIRGADVRSALRTPLRAAGQPADGPGRRAAASRLSHAALPVPRLVPPHQKTHLAAQTVGPSITQEIPMSDERTASRTSSVGGGRRRHDVR